MKMALNVETLWSQLWISKSIKGETFVKMHLRVVAYIQNVALVMVNKYVKFDEESFNGSEAMAMSVFFKGNKSEVI